VIEATDTLSRSFNLMVVVVKGGQQQRESEEEEQFPRRPARAAPSPFFSIGFQSCLLYVSTD